MTAAIHDLWMACYTQEAIAEKLEIPRETVRDKIADFGENGNFADSAIFRNFEDDDSEDSGRRVYTVWNSARPLSSGGWGVMTIKKLPMLLGSQDRQFLSSSILYQSSQTEPAPFLTFRQKIPNSLQSRSGSSMRRRKRTVAGGLYAGGQWD